MSSLPTLLRKGYIIPPKNTTKADAEKIGNTVSIDYILGIVANKIQNISTGRILETATSAGDRVLVLKSDTGSGKSTILPPKLYERFNYKIKRSIMVTQPRVLTAIDIPNTIVEYNKSLKMGKNIGYSTGEFKNPPVDGGILFATIGILLQDLLINTDEDFIMKYQFIIVDEVHERDMQTDLCLYLLKGFLQRNYDSLRCPLVILMSATFDENIFINYFGVPSKNYIQVKGSTFPITTQFTKYTVTDYVKYASLQAQKIHMDNLDEIQNHDDKGDEIQNHDDKGDEIQNHDDTGDENISSVYRDIIIFVKDSGIAKKIYRDLHVFNSKICTDETLFRDYGIKIEEDINALMLGGTIKKSHFILPILLDSKNFNKGSIDYQNLFSSIEIVNAPIWRGDNYDDAPDGYVKPSRRVIISTNVAETGVTIPTLKYCIDTGYELKMEFYPEYGCNSLITKNISSGSAIQRRGRVGRKAPGLYYPCYTEATFDLLPTDKVFEIVNNDPTETLLNILIKIKNVEITHVDNIAIIANNQNEDIFHVHSDVTGDWFRVVNELSTNISALDLLEPPSIQSICYSIEKLYILGYIDCNYDVTAPGYIINKLEWISLESKRFILASYVNDVSTIDAITIAAFIYVDKRNIFDKGFDITKLYKGKFESQCDFINCLVIWDAFNGIEKDIELVELWCTKMKLKYEGLMQVIYMRNKIISDMVTLGLNPNYNAIYTGEYVTEESIRGLKTIIYEGFKGNLMQWKLNNTYRSLQNNVKLKVKSETMRMLKTNPQYIICSSYTMGQKFGEAQYELIADSFVSVMDGFVDVDPKFYLY
jgi:HrpA-like RNA helicase